VKIQLDFDSAGKDFLDCLLEQTDSKTYKDLFNCSLTLLQWAIKQRVEGRSIASVDENNQTYRELVMPAIEAAILRQPKDDMVPNDTDTVFDPQHGKKQTKELVCA
jgi:hypothetical protein